MVEPLGAPKADVTPPCGVLARPAAGKPMLVPVGPGAWPPKVGPPGWPNPNPAAAASPGKLLCKLLRLLLSWVTTEGLRLGGPIGETETVPVGAAKPSPLNKPWRPSPSVPALASPAM